MSSRPTIAYVSARHGPVVWSVRTPCAQPRLNVVLQDPEGALARADILKASDTCMVGRVEGVVIKRWRPKGWLQGLKVLVRGARAGRVARRALALEAAGVRTAIPLAWGVSSRFLPPGPSYLVMEEIPGDADLKTLRSDRRQRFESLGSLIGSLHRSGFTHRDLKPSNIRILADGEACLIDLDGVSHLQHVPERQAVADLVKLGRRMVELATLLPSDAAWFLSAYCRARGIRARRTWWRLLKAAAIQAEEFRPLARPRRSRPTGSERHRSSDPRVS